MTSTTPDSPATARRRSQLKRWIDELHDGNQANFIASTNDGNTQVNQGELSGLLKKKSFGEKRARRLEIQAGMPTGYLDADVAPGQPTLFASEPAATYNGGNVVHARASVIWPFHLVTYERLVAVRRAIGPRAAGELMRELDRYFDYVVSNAELGTVKAKKTSGK